MKKHTLLSRISAVVLLFTIVFGGFACSPSDKLEQVDEMRTQLYVASYDGGHGNAWLEQLKKDFEEEYKEVSFEEGRKGVQIMISKEKDIYNTMSIVNTIATSSQEIYFAQGDSIDAFLAKNALLDITDIVTENLSEKFGENKTIENKMKEFYVNHYKRDGKYYCLPHGSSLLGVIYDVDLFDDEELYFKQGGGWTNLDGELTSGPDGIADTYDDGLPATYEDFFELCRVMKSRNIVPLSWTGTYMTGYTDFLLKSLWVDYEGFDKAMLQFNAGTIEGKNTTDIITGFDNNDAPIINDNHIVSVSNYKDIAKQPGRYYALKFFEEIIEEGFYYHLSTNIDQTHVMAQYDFLNSRYEEEKIAMLIEGTWWENEASDAEIFSDLVNLYGEEASLKSRRFSLMPMPKQSEDKIGRGTLFNSRAGSCFINANIDKNKIALAKEFLQYSLTDRALNQYTEITGSLQSYDYDITQDTYDKLSYFSKSCLDIMNNSDIVIPYIASLSVNNSIGDMEESLYSNYSKVRGVIENKFFNTLRSASEVTAKEYFLGLYDAL